MMYCLTEQEYLDLKKPPEIKKLEADFRIHFDKAMSAFLFDSVDIVKKFGGWHTPDRGQFLTEMKECFHRHQKLYDNPTQPSSTNAPPLTSST